MWLPGIVCMMLVLHYASTSMGSEFTWYQYYNGNAVNSIQAVGNDLWLGNQVGLVRINGESMQMEHFNNGNSGLGANYVSSIAVDSKGNKAFGILYDWSMGYSSPSMTKLTNESWATIDTGIVPGLLENLTFDSEGSLYATIMDSVGLWTMESTERWAMVKGFGEVRITSITSGSRGCLIIGSSQGVFRLHDTETELFDTSNTVLPSNDILDATESADGTIWCIVRIKADLPDAYDQGSYYLCVVGGDSSRVLPLPLLDKEHARGLAVGTNGFIYISVQRHPIYAPVKGDSNCALLVRSEGSWTRNPFGSPRLRNSSITRPALTANGAAWIGMSSEVAHYYGGTVSVHDVDNISPFASPGELAMGPQGILYHISLQRISEYDGSQWHSTDIPVPMHAGSIRGSTIDLQGNIWVGRYHSGGLARFDGSEWTVYDTVLGNFPEYYVESICCDSNGVVWAGTGNGVVSFDGSEWTKHTETSTWGVHASFVDRNNTKVFGCTRGVFVYDGEWDSIPGLDGGMYTSIIRDKEGALWFSKKFSGIYVHDGDSTRRICSENSPLPDNGVFHLSVDSHDRIWISTWKGLALLDGDRWQLFRPFHSGIPHSSTGTLIQLNENEYWLRTFHAITRIEENGTAHSRGSPDRASPVSGHTIAASQDIVCFDLRGRRIRNAVVETGGRFSMVLVKTRGKNGLVGVRLAGASDLIDSRHCDMDLITNSSQDSDAQP